MLCTATDGTALVLGGVRDSVYLGQPLKLSIPLQLHAQDKLSDLCIVAEVFYGDALQSLSQVTVTEDPLGPGRSAIASVTESNIVNEPVVNVTVQAGCKHKVSRRYVLLADLPSTSTAASTASAASRAATPESTLNPGDIAPPSRASVPTVESGATRPQKSRKSGKTAKKLRGAGSTGGQAPLRPRLTLDMLDLRTPQPDAVLTFSKELTVNVNPEDVDPAQRAQTKALWHLLNMDSEDALREYAQLQSVEQELKDLRDVTARNRATLQELSGRLETSASNRYPAVLVYGLLAALLACAAALLYTWTRTRRGGAAPAPWWRDGGDAAEPSGSGMEPVVTTDPRTAASWTAGSPQSAIDADIPPKKSASPQQQPPSASSASSSRQAAAPVPPVPPVPAPGQRDFVDSARAALGAINTNEMLDVSHQAEFFLTLGQHDAAVDLLKDSIRTNHESNPLVYLDLLKLLHNLGRKTDYNQYRNAFHTLFTGRIPPYAGFNQPGKNLEAYPETCLRIVTLWPSVQAIAFIEDCLVRQYGDADAHTFELEAFRDLLLLHNIATTLLSSTDTGTPLTTSMGAAPFTATQKVSIKPGATPNTSPTKKSPPQPASQEMSIDLDLSEEEPTVNLKAHPTGNPTANLMDFDASSFSTTPESPRKIMKSTTSVPAARRG